MINAAVMVVLPTSVVFTDTLQRTHTTCTSGFQGTLNGRCQGVFGTITQRTFGVLTNGSNADTK